MKPLYIIAGNSREFEQWCLENRVAPSSPLVSYVSDANRLRGLRNPEIVSTGTYRTRKDFHELNSIVRNVCKPEEPKIVYVEVPVKPKPVVFLHTFGSRLVNWQ